MTDRNANIKGKQANDKQWRNKVVYEIRSNAWEYETIVHVADTKGARSQI